MGFFNALKRAFGFGEEDDSFYNEEYDASTAIYAADSTKDEEPATASHPTPPVFEKADSEAPEITTAHENEKPAACEPKADVACEAEPTGADNNESDSPACRENETADPAATENETRSEADSGKRKVACSVETLPADLFDTVIELFNEFQPAFVRDCLSVEKEREKIIASIAARLESTGPDDVKASSDRIAELEALVAVRDHTINENRRYRDSLERQNTSLLSRIEALEDHMRRLRAGAIKPLEETPAPVETRAPAGPATAEDGVAVEAAEDSEEVKALKAEIERLTAMSEQLELKSRMSDKMLSDLRNSSAASRHELEEAKAAHQAELDALAAEHSRELAEIERDQNEAAQSILAQLSEFEGLKSRLESRIVELKDSLKSEREKTKQLSEEVASLRSTIETNLYNQANSEMRLRSEIKQLRSQIAPASSAAEALASDGEAVYQRLDTKVPTPAKESAPCHPEPVAAPAPVETAPDTIDADVAAVFSPEPPKRRRGRPRKQEFESELDNPSGFMPAGRKDDPEFGYHEPPRRPSNDSSAQLSLF